MSRDQYNGLLPGGHTTTGGQPYTPRRNKEMKYTPVQLATFGQSYNDFVRGTPFEDAINKELNDGRSPVEIKEEFLAVASVLPGHREEFALRIEHAAIWLQLGVVE